jgi:uncharacterized protein (DUF3084 family)
MNRRSGIVLTGALLLASSVALAGVVGGGTATPAAVVSAKSQVDTAKENVKKAREELRATRVERRKAHREEARAKLKDVATRPDGRDELRTHGRRLARLHHMRTLAKELGKDGLVKRVDALIAKENTRFERRVDELRHGTPGTATGAPAGDKDKGEHEKEKGEHEKDKDKDKGKEGAK